MTQSGGDRNVRHSRRAFVQWVGAGALGIAASACYGFSNSGGFPPKLKTVAVIPFDNQTGAPEVQGELGDAIRKLFRDRLNLRDAPEEKADVIVRGTIGKYDVDLPAGVSADPRSANVSRRKLQLVVDIEIVDQTNGHTLLSRKAMQSEGQYAEGQETAGRKLAIETMVNDIIQGVQSQW